MLEFGITMETHQYNRYGVKPFTGMEFSNWKFRLNAILEENECPVDILNDPSVKNYKKRNAMAKNIIIQCLGNNQLEMIKDCESASDMMEKLCEKYEKKSLSEKLYLKRKLMSMKFNEKESLESFLLSFEENVRALNNSDSIMEESEKICNLLLTLPKSYEFIVASIETMVSKSEISYDFVRNRLLDEEVKRKSSLESKTSVRQSVSSDQAAFIAFKYKCYRCGKPGHKRSQCRVKLNTENSVPKFNKQQFSKGANHANNTSSVSKEVTFLSSDEVLDTEWCIDSGATEHMCNNKELFFSLTELGKPVKIAVAKKKESLNATMIGNIKLQCKNDSGGITNITMTDVLYVPDLACNLFSINKITEKGMYAVMKGNSVDIRKGEEILAVGRKKGKLFILNLEYHNECISYIAPTTNNNDLWHKRLGHMSKGNMLKLSQMVDGFDFKEKPTQEVCEICVQSKQSKLPHKSERIRAQRPLQLIHSDICGPMNPESFDGMKYFITFIDDFSHFVQIRLMKNKSEAFACFQDYVAEAESHFNMKISRLRCDNGGEYKSNQFIRFCTEKGIRLEYTMPYTPEQNGVSERFNRTIVEKARAMLLESKCSKELWGEACMAACYVINRIPTSVTDKVPAEIWFKHQQNISKLRVFGCVAYLHTPKQFCSKFGSKTRKYLFVGYCSNGYRLYDPESQEIVTGRDITFNEENFNIETNSDDNDNTQEASAIIQDSVNDDTTDNINTLRTSDDQERETTERPRRNINPPVWSQDYEFESYTSCALFTGEMPTTAEEAFATHEKKLWEAAVKDELNSHKEHGTWERVPRPSNVKVIDSKWVFTVKNSESNSVRFKARLVAKGYQTDSYGETFSPVAQLATLRTLLAVAVQKNMNINQMDVKTAFLNGYVEQDIYMNLPEDMFEEEYVCKLKRSIYGLKESPRQWNKVFNDFIISMGFKQCKSDYCLYVNSSKDEIIYILLYVDDLLIVCQDVTYINEIKSALLERFQMQDMGNISHFLGLDITRTNDELSISQSNYLAKIVEKFGLENCNPVKTPMEVQNHLLTDEIEEQSNDFDKPYRLLLGSLMYAMLCSRPDLSYSLNYLSRFQNNPNETVWQMLKRVLRYVKGTLDLKLVFKKNMGCILTGYSDADWGNDTQSRKSTTGFAFYVHNNLVSWSSRKQPTVALSSTEAEYMAICTALTEGLWVRSILTEMCIDLGVPSIKLFEDNQGCIQLCKNPVNPKRSKHIDIKYHFIRENVSSGIVEIIFIPTASQIADIFTKSLPGPSFCALREKLCLM